MLMRAFLLLALVANANGFIQGDIADLLTYMNQHNEHLRTMVHRHISPYTPMLHKMLHSFDSPDACQACHEKGARFVMEHAMVEMGKVCQAASNQDCKMAKLCKLMALKPNVTMGMMIEHVRPFSLTSAYCAGKGLCPLPDASDLANMEMGKHPHEVLLEHFDQVDWHNVMDRAHELQPQEEDEHIEELEDAEPCELPHAVCPKCMKKSMKHVMRHVVGKMKGMCGRSNCPRMQRMCHFAHEHRGIAFGMLLAKVEPWKFAFGHCVGHHGNSFWQLVKQVKNQIQQLITV